MVFKLGGSWIYLEKADRKTLSKLRDALSHEPQCLEADKSFAKSSCFTFVVNVFNSNALKDLRVQDTQFLNSIRGKEQ